MTTTPVSLATRPMHNRESYNADMRRTIGSKMFFLDHLPLADIKQFIDFGCADAALLKALHQVCPKAEMIGVDNDPHQRAAAIKNFPGIWDLASSLWKVDVDNWEHGNKALILSSVIHEVLSADDNPVLRFNAWWRRIEEMGFDYIAIRDFSVPHFTKNASTPSAWLESVMQRRDDWSRMVDVSMKWGACSNLYNFMHFLLKRPYAENWQRELGENYLALDQDQLLNAVTASGLYAVKHIRHTQTKFFRERTTEDLGFCPDIPTHAELVLVRAEWHPNEVLVAPRMLHRPNTAGPYLDRTGGAGAVANDQDGMPGRIGASGYLRRRG